jgi:arylsulfatase A-like enzyme
VIHTPHLDRLAKSGFTFTSAYCMGATMPAVCNPSRHMVLSGMSLYRYDPMKVEGTFRHDQLVRIAHTILSTPLPN